MKMKRIISTLLTAALMTMMVACGNSGSADSAEPEANQSAETESTSGPDSESAAEEQPYAGTTLSVMLAYGGADASFDAFTEKTGINVEYVEISTGEALAQIQAEGGSTTSDIWFGGGLDSYLAATELGYLEPYVSPEADAIDPAYRDKDGNWTGLALVPAGLLVNNDILQELGLEAPETWEDLADPKYKDEIIMASPAISGTQYAILNGTLQAWGEEKGWDIWSKINDNVDFYAKGGGEPGPKCCQGEYAIAIMAMTGSTFELENQYPVTAIYPTDMIPWTTAPIAIFESSENKDAAKVFVDYYLSQEGQSALSQADARIMTRSDVDIPDGIGNVDTSLLIKQDVLLFGTQREALLEKWAALVGDKDA